MLKAKLMNQVKNKFGGKFVKNNGRWYWGEQLVTTNWLINKLNETVRPDEPIKKVQTEVAAPVTEPVLEAAPIITKKPVIKKKKETDTI